MSDKKKYSKDTDRDVRPAKGQESNENWDDTSEKEPDTRVSDNTGKDSKKIDTDNRSSNQDAE